MPPTSSLKLAASSTRVQPDTGRDRLPMAVAAPIVAVLSMLCWV